MRKYLIPFAVGGFAFLVSACLIFAESTSKALAATAVGSPVVSVTDWNFGQNGDNYFVRYPIMSQTVDLDRFSQSYSSQMSGSISSGAVTLNINSSSSRWGTNYASADIEVFYPLAVHFRSLPIGCYSGDISFNMILSPTMTIYDEYGDAYSLTLIDDYSARFSLSLLDTGDSSLWYTLEPVSNNKWSFSLHFRNYIQRSVADFIISLPLQFNFVFNSSDYYEIDEWGNVFYTEYTVGNLILTLSSSFSEPSYNVSPVSFVADQDYYSFLTALNNASTLTVSRTQLQQIKGLLQVWFGTSNASSVPVSFPDFAQDVLSYLSTIPLDTYHEFESDIGDILSMMSSISGLVSSSYTWSDSAGEHTFNASELSTNELLLLLLSQASGYNLFDSQSLDEFLSDIMQLQNPADNLAVSTLKDVISDVSSTLAPILNSIYSQSQTTYSTIDTILQMTENLDSRLYYIVSATESTSLLISALNSWFISSDQSLSGFQSALIVAINRSVLSDIYSALISYNSDFHLSIRRDLNSAVTQYVDGLEAIGNTLVAGQMINSAINTTLGLLNVSVGLIHTAIDSINSNISQILQLIQLQATLDQNTQNMFDQLELFDSENWGKVNTGWQNLINDPVADAGTDLSEPISLFQSIFSGLYNGLGNFKYVIAVSLVAGFLVICLGKINQFGKLF